MGARDLTRGEMCDFRMRGRSGWRKEPSEMGMDRMGLDGWVLGTSAQVVPPIFRVLWAETSGKKGVRKKGNKGDSHYTQT